MNAPGPAAQDLIDFVLREADVLDRRDYDAWYALFTEDARYWVPMAATQTDARTEQSIAYEDKLLLKIRIERLRGPRTYSHQPGVASQHVLQTPLIETNDAVANRFVTRTPFVYIEARGADQLMLAGTATHRLRLEATQLRIVEKRIDLVNAGAPLPSIFLFL